MKEEGILKTAAKAAAIGFGYVAGFVAGFAVTEKVQKYFNNKKAKENDSEEKES